jgi:hypothetical protein
LQSSSVSEVCDDKVNLVSLTVFGHANYAVLGYKSRASFVSLLDNTTFLPNQVNIICLYDGDGGLIASSQLYLLIIVLVKEGHIFTVERRVYPKLVLVRGSVI